MAVVLFGWPQDGEVFMVANVDAPVTIAENAPGAPMSYVYYFPTIRQDRRGVWIMEFEGLRLY